MKKLLLLVPLFFMSCTYSINLVHTEGRANDVIDETNTNAPKLNVKPMGTTVGKRSLLA